MASHRLLARLLEIVLSEVEIDVQPNVSVMTVLLSIWVINRRNIRAFIRHKTPLPERF